MAAPDPVDIRLLALLAEVGRAPVHEVAGRLGMDPREVAARLVALSGSGLPLVVGVECDPNGVRSALAAVGAWPNYGGGYPAPGGQSGFHPVPTGTQSAAYPAPQGTQSAAYPAPPGTQSAAYPAPQRGYPAPGYPPQGQPRPEQQFPGQAGPVPAGQQAPAGQQVPQQGPAGQQVPQQGSAGQQVPQQGPAGQQQAGASAPFPAPGADPMSTWGPPQSSAWARGDQPTRPVGPNQPAGGAGGAQQGSVGDTLRTEGQDGGQVAVRLVEIVDPADFLFSAAGYRLREGERAVVVHTELSNRGPAPFPTLPDLYLMLVSPDGQGFGKAPVSLSSRPPHRFGVPPGETAGGHTVYVLPADATVAAVRWSQTPDDDAHTLTWTIRP